MKQRQMISVHDITLLYVFYRNNVFVICPEPVTVDRKMKDSLMLDTVADDQRLATIAPGRRSEQVVSGRKPVITPRELHELLGGDKAIELLDVRTPGEYAAAHVPGARLLPLADLDAGVFLRQRCVGERPIYLICQTTRRARSAIRKFQRVGFGNCVLVEGGTRAWMDAGLPVKRGESRVLPLIRQVQIAVGFLGALGAVLALTVNPLFAVLPLLIGCGLVFAGVTGICGLALLLARMPWNRLGENRTASCCQSET
jgi:rhodanese-related sulfurtransferase